MFIKKNKIPLCLRAFVAIIFRCMFLNFPPSPLLPFYPSLAAAAGRYVFQFLNAMIYLAPLLVSGSWGS